MRSIISFGFLRTTRIPNIQQLFSHSFTFQCYGQILRKCNYCTRKKFEYVPIPTKSEKLFPVTTMHNNI